MAGPVVAAAAMLETYRFKNRIDDSKKLSPRLREMAFPEIVEKSVFGVGIANEKIIDELNILEATRLAMKWAINALLGKLDILNRRLHIIVDGNMSLDIPFAYTCIVRGDSKSKSIASASILAKVIRDSIMQQYDVFYPQYGFSRHKGYPTREHRDMLRKIGPCLIHRKTFCNA